MTIPFKRTLSIVFAVFAMVIMVLILAPHALAQGGGGGVGGGGGAGGCTTCGGASTNNGYGWYRYSSSASAPRPAGMQDGTNWDSVRSFCRGSGNDTVFAFIIQTAARTPTTAVVYRYNAPDFNKYFDYKGDDGGNWTTHEQAKAYYDSLPASAKIGWTWGSNVAWFCYNFANNWSVSGTSHIKKNSTTTAGWLTGTISATPGDQISFFHDLRNNGPQSMDKQVYYTVPKSGFTGSWNTSNPTGYASGGVGSTFVQLYASLNSPFTRYTVTQNDVGRTLCERISWASRAWNDSSTGYSNNVCVNVPYNYTLVPTIQNITDGDPIQNGTGAFDVVGRVTNNGPTKSQPSVNWQVTEVRFASGATLTNKPGGASGSNPCGYFTGNIGCASLQSGTEASGYAYPNNNTHTGSANIDDLPAGTRVCYAMSVTKYNQSTTNWMHSQLYCLTVIRQPAVHVTGGDLLVGRGSAYNPARISDVMTSTPAVLSGAFYGSWSEYAVVSSGLVSKMASGSGYVGGSTTKNLCSLSVLTFTNASTTGCIGSGIGNYSHGSSAAPNVASRFPVVSTTPRISSSSGTPVALSGLDGLYTTDDAALSVTGGADIGEVSPNVGRAIIINAPNATVTIADNIRYTTNGISSIDGIPQVVIIARNIVIAGGVTQVDSWLVAVGSDAGGIQNGVVNTCGDVANVTDLRTTNCNQRLVVNGPIVANHLLMRRTYSGATAGDINLAAETFNLRADAYIWGTNYQPGTGRLPTVTVTELPPRF